MPSAQRLEHVQALDGLRYLAAAIVLVGHCWNGLTKPAAFAAAVRGSPLALFINGYGAVHLFFILSGFCLAGSADRARRPVELAQFYVRRIFRIHPPYAFALATAWLASFFYDASRAGGGLTPYLIRRAGVHLPLPELLPYFLYPSPAEYQLGPAWTLTVEMHFSFLLPLMLWLTRAAHWSLLLALSALPLLDGGRLPGFLDYALHFALGIALFQERERLAGWLARAPALLQAGLFAAGLFLFAAPFMFDLIFAAGFRFAASGLAVSAAGGTLLLCAALYLPGVRRLLETRPLVFGGRISYSFYLLHYPILILAAGAVRGPLGPLGAALFVGSVLLATSAAAALAFPGVERPSIRLGNAVCRALARRAHAAAQLSRLAR